jgi:hypothetical protein
MERYIESQARILPPEKIRREHQMRRGRNRQELAQALNDSENK